VIVVRATSHNHAHGIAPLCTSGRRVHPRPEIQRHPWGELAQQALARCVGDRIRFDAEALQALQREGVFVIRRDRDLFAIGHDTETLTRVQGDLDMRAILSRGQRVLFEDDYVGGNTLLPALVQRFMEQCEQLGFLAWLKDQETLEQWVYRILGTNPLLLRRAIRECMASFVETTDAAPLPETIVSDTPLRPSRRNIYGVMPGDLNTWEIEFAEMLDLDATGQVLWWHRNPPRKPWSVRVCAPGTTHDYYPDFAIGLRGRATPDGVLLAETKFAYNTKDSMAKVRADHKAYKNILMLTRDDQNTWWTLQYDLIREKVVEDRRLHLSMLAGF
jgi:type III restriction enzyme